MMNYNDVHTNVPTQNEKWIKTVDSFTTLFWNGQVTQNSQEIRFDKWNVE